VRSRNEFGLAFVKVDQCRVALGRYLPRAPTDPDLRN
jgi:hypothetical protein